MVEHTLESFTGPTRQTEQNKTKQYKTIQNNTNQYKTIQSNMPATLIMSNAEKQTSLEPNGSNGSTESQSPASSHDSGSKKRDTKSAGLDSNGNPKPVKRRAAKACAACRARKVRCDVMQRYHVTPDGEFTSSNCTMDVIKCVIEESKRRK